MKTGWTLDIKTQAWVEDTENQVDFLIRAMGLNGNERILDLACGFGRHALSFSRRGFTVVGVDFTDVYIKDAKANAKASGLCAEFILSDIRDVRFHEEFDVVLNMADGAIGYLDTDEENLKVFDVIAQALKPGGKHFMDICSAEHAENYFPKRSWLAGSSELSLSEFSWDAAERKMYFSGYQLPYGGATRKPVLEKGEGTRLYSAGELKDILAARNMEVISTFSDYYGTESSSKYIQLMVYSRKNPARI